MLRNANRAISGDLKRKTHRSEGFPVADKLGIGSTFPHITLDLVDGGTLELPDGVDAKYRILLFYRGHW